MKKPKTNSKEYAPAYSLQQYLQWPRYGSRPCSSTDECIHKLWYVYTMEYYLAIKKKDLQQHGWTSRVSC